MAKKHSGLMMDKAAKKLEKIHAVSGWILEHWTHFPENLYKLVEDEYVPFDVKEFLVDLVQQDFANAITPAIRENWKLFAPGDNVTLPDEAGGQAE